MITTKLLTVSWASFGMECCPNGLPTFATREEKRAFYRCCRVSYAFLRVRTQIYDTIGRRSLRAFDVLNWVITKAEELTLRFV